jgi:hypothetical protein
MPHLPLAALVRSPLARRAALVGGAALALAVLVSACRINGEPLAPGASAALPEMVLRAYDVPAAHAQEVRNIVSSLLWRGDGQPRQGNVVVAPTGQLLVAAPASFHDGVAQLTADLQKAPPPPPSAIAIDYWIVRAVPPGTDAAPAPVEELPPDAVTAIRALARDAPLTLFDHSRLLSIASERAEVERRGAQIAQTASAQGNTVIADINIKTEIGNLQVRAALPVDKTIVLAQGSNAANGAPGQNGAVFYMVRATLPNAK